MTDSRHLIDLFTDLVGAVGQRCTDPGPVREVEETLERALADLEPTATAVCQPPDLIVVHAGPSGRSGERSAAIDVRSGEVVSDETDLVLAAAIRRAMQDPKVADAVLAWAAHTARRAIRNAAVDAARDTLVSLGSMELDRRVGEARLTGDTDRAGAIDALRVGWQGTATDLLDAVDELVDG